MIHDLKMTIFIFLNRWTEKDAELKEENWLRSYLTNSMDSKVSFDPKVREMTISCLKQICSNQNPNVHVHWQELWTEQTETVCDGAAHSSRCDAWKYPAFHIFLTDGKQNKALTFGNG